MEKTFREKKSYKQPKKNITIPVFIKEIKKCIKTKKSNPYRKTHRCSEQRGSFSILIDENLRSSVPPPIIERSKLGGSWRRLTEKKNHTNNKKKTSPSLYLSKKLKNV